MPEEMKAEFNPKPVFSSDQTTSEHPPKSQSTRTFHVYVEDEYFKVDVDPVDGSINQMVPTSNQSNLIASQTNAPNASDGGSENSGPTDGETLVSPMPGILLRYLVEEGDEVKIGEPVAILEAMKMENTLPSPATGTIQNLRVTAGATVVKGDVLLVIA